MGPLLLLPARGQWAAREGARKPHLRGVSACEPVCVQIRVHIRVRYARVSSPFALSPLEPRTGESRAQQCAPSTGPGDECRRSAAATRSLGSCFPAMVPGCWRPFLLRCSGWDLSPQTWGGSMWPDSQASYTLSPNVLPVTMEHLQPDSKMSLVSIAFIFTCVVLVH